MCKSQKFSTVFPHRMFSTFPPYVEIVEKSVISFIYHVFLSTVFPQQAARPRNVFHFSTISVFHMVVFRHFFFHRWWKTLNCLIFIADFSTFPVENLVGFHFPSVVFHKFCRFVNDVLHIKENGNHVIGRQIAKRTHRSIV